MFNFRIITCPDGTQVIDHSLKTPYSALNPVQMEEYMEIDNQIAFMERLKRKEQRESECKIKHGWNPFYKLASACGLFRMRREKSCSGQQG